MTFRWGSARRGEPRFVPSPTEDRKAGSLSRIRPAMKGRLNSGRAPWRALALIAAISVPALVPLRPVVAAAEPARIDAVMALHAKDLHDQLGRKHALVGGLGRRIAIWPYAPDERLPISHEQARLLNDRLEHELQRLSEGKYDFRGRRELRTVIGDLAEAGRDVDDAIAVVTSHASADILITGKFSINGDRITSNFKAVGLRGSWTGSILATTGTRELAHVSGRQQVQLTQFLQHAAYAFAEGAHDMTELHLAGIQFQDSGQQPEFGGYMERMLTAEIVDAFRRKGHAIKVKRAELSKTQLGGMRGSVVDPRKLKPKNFDPRTGVYVLSGTYWDIGRSVDLVLNLSDSNGAPVTYRASIIKQSIGANLKLHPESDLNFLRKNVLRGPVKLRVTSARGKDPVYRLNDKLNLLIEVSQNAWLYCFYLQSTGELFKIYPNNYKKPAALAGGRLHTIPGRLFPFDFTITEPVGVDLVKCFASKRDVLKDLPKPLRRLEVEPLPAGMIQRLRDAFARTRASRVSEASLVITVNR